MIFDSFQVIKDYQDIDSARLDHGYLESCGLQPVILSGADRIPPTPPLKAPGLFQIVINKSEFQTAYQLLYSSNPEDFLAKEQNFYIQQKLTPKKLPIQILDQAWKFAIIGSIILPVFSHIYSLYLLQKSWFLLDDQEKTNEVKSKYFIIVFLNLTVLYIVFKFFQG